MKSLTLHTPVSSDVIQIVTGKDKSPYNSAQTHSYQNIFVKFAVISCVRNTILPRGRI